MSKVAERYARALFDAAKQKGVLERTVEDIRTVERAIAGSHDFALMLKSPVVSFDKKEHVFHEAFKAALAGETLSFFELVIHKGREREIPDVVKSFNRMWDEECGVVRAEITSAVALDEADRKSVVARLATITKKKVEAEFDVKPAIKGGFVAKVDDIILDGSIANQLERLRKAMLEGSLN